MKKLIILEQKLVKMVKTLFALTELFGIFKKKRTNNYNDVSCHTKINIAKCCYNIFTQ